MTSSNQNSKQVLAQQGSVTAPGFGFQGKPGYGWYYTSNGVRLAVNNSDAITVDASGVTLATALPVGSGGTGQTSYTNGQLLIGNSTGNTLAKATLTAGAGISITNGAGSIAIALAAAQPKGADLQTFNASGTWTKPSGYSANSRVLIQCWGGGGSGGKSTYGGGGGGGGYNERWVTLSDMGATETITVGAGGASRTTAAAGLSGGDTSVGSLVTAYGGAGGYAGTLTIQSTGGGGGGPLSAGVQGTEKNALPGNPRIASLLLDTACGITSYINVFQGGGAYDGYQTADCFWHGGGGGGYNKQGGNSLYGGGGGGPSYPINTAGTSKYAGNGGAGSNAASATAGTAPAGGGGGVGATAGWNSGAGAAGRVIITVFDGV